MSHEVLRQPRSQLWLLDLGIIGIALSWGASYSLMQLIIQAGVAVPLFLMLRFALAVPFMFIGTRIRFSSFTRGEVINGIIFGVLLYTILTFETLGVKYTTAANAGFLIALSVILVPFFERILGKRRQSGFIWFSCFISLIGGGLISLSGSERLGFNLGDTFILLAAFIRGFQIYLFGQKTSGKSWSLVNITLIELVTVAILGLIYMLFQSWESLMFIPKIPLKIWGDLPPRINPKFH
ncbi:hypothetical protein VR7878_01219 [Vibrio ruber DSM 16370]|uniref:EamA domain-containing protein n=1 Tax=Vibrio ruber (strain DSM 16370 / JCM 11486 / BCRC 17186 / CECT 7878 / LMG 23124 / VR1) TaxID=1123498 RepID=A0A1R4LFL9_VIBR1|nr:EamA family transporter [Vibrio ruber]SJN55371.1 hypothetical protein VR7878_01219 [Vibrio ruber DSM 16370]